MIRMTHLTIFLAISFLGVVHVSAKSGSSWSSSSCPSMSSRSNPPFYRFKLGKLRGTVVSDGKPSINGNPFDVPDAAFARSLRFLRRTPPFTIGLNVAIVDLPDARVMIDTGGGESPSIPTFTSGCLVRNMRRAGISPNSIDAIFITHAHFDHVGGLTDSFNRRVFKRADLYISRGEHQFMLTGKNQTRPFPFASTVINVSFQVYRRLIPQYAKSLKLFEGTFSPFKGMQVVRAPGHTDNHYVYKFSSMGKTLFVVGDAWVSQASQLQNPEWSFVPEANSRMAYHTRIRILNSGVRNGSLFVPYHEDFPGIGYVIRNGPWFDWVPAMDT